MRRNRPGSPMDYFLGGKLTGPIILFFTMQATQYSGNTFFGFTGMAYRSGLIWILILPIVCLIITTQISFAPRLYVLSKMYNYMTRVGRIFTVVILGLVVFASLKTTETLWRLTEIKIEFLMQLFPALIIGLYWPQFTKWLAIAGLVVGCCVLAVMMIMGWQQWGYFQAGIYAFAINLTICLIIGLMMKPDEQEGVRISDSFFFLFKSKH